MNIYKYKFCVKCPNDEAAIWYRLEIKTDAVIMAEDISSYCDSLAPSFQEDIAGPMHREFGGVQRITAYHSRVKVTTIRK